MPGLMLGVSAEELRVPDLVLHFPSRLLGWPAKGVIYGRQGAPVGTVCSDGYVRLGAGQSLSGGSCLYAHRIIWECVHGAIPAGMEIDHLNGRKTDNRIRNLELVTRGENVRRAVASGLAPVGEQRSDAKLTEAHVLAIRCGDKPVKQWARELEVDPRTIRSARDGTTWRHVPLRGRVKSRPRLTNRRPTGPEIGPVTRPIERSAPVESISLLRDTPARGRTGADESGED
ncbi:HNH endonuclease signature motif containing protein [Novilysobacter viscosus]|uniref:HNH endonuclease signature motif containing protein n=1 Tax=Novilysobacter viscosus TaxID=3098602 RepID=UPI003F8814C5